MSGKNQIECYVWIQGISLIRHVDTASIASSVNSDASFKTADYFFSMPATPPHTTVSPNDNDEGLYLLWTHQLLRERGYEPGRLDDDDDDEQEDEQDNEHNSRGIQVKPSTNDTIMHDMDNDEEEERDSDVESKSSSDSSLTERSIISGSLVATTPDLRLYSTFDDQSIRRRYSYSYKPSMSTSSFYASHRQEEEEQGSSSFSRFLKSCFSSCQ